MLFRLEHLLKRITQFAGAIAGVSLIALIALVFGNMALRYAAGIGAMWTQELEGMLLALTSISGIAYAMAHNDHVRIDVFSSRLGRIPRLWLELVTLVLIALPVIALLAWYSVPFVEIAYQRNERSPNAGGLQTLWIYKTFLLLGLFFLAVETLRQILATTRRLRRHHARARSRDRQRGTCSGVAHGARKI